MKRLRIKKDVVIYHPSILVAEKGSILRCDFILFGEFGNRAIMNGSLNKEKFAEYFELLEDNATGRVTK